MSAILKFDFQKRKQNIKFFWRKLSKLHKKKTILHVTITVFPKTRGNKNKQWTRFSTLKVAKICMAMESGESYQNAQHYIYMAKHTCVQKVKIHDTV